MSLRERKDEFDVEYLLCMDDDNADKVTETDATGEDKHFDFFVYETQMDALTRNHSLEVVEVRTDVGMHHEHTGRSRQKPPVWHSLT
jgi:hypothetical protein